MGDGAYKMAFFLGRDRARPPAGRGVSVSRSGIEDVGITRDRRRRLRLQRRLAPGAGFQVEASLSVSSSSSVRGRWRVGRR